MLTLQTTVLGYEEAECSKPVFNKSWLYPNPSGLSLRGRHTKTRT